MPGEKLGYHVDGKKEVIPNPVLILSSLKEWNCCFGYGDTLALCGCLQGVVQVGFAVGRR
ncbi:MAG: hypothetical protein GX887_03535 [Firmicutes bacterium]|nr:hypothetical protein [Bacillota bacterium]